jgi:hypothetical protein
VKHQIELSLSEDSPEGRPPLLSKDVQEVIFKLIQNRYDSKDPIAIPKLTEFISERFEIILSYDTLGKIIARNSKFHTVIGEPIEKNRVLFNSDELV